MQNDVAEYMTTYLSTIADSLVADPGMDRAQLNEHPQMASRRLLTMTSTVRRKNELYNTALSRNSRNKDRHKDGCVRITDWKNRLHVSLRLGRVSDRIVSAAG